MLKGIKKLLLFFFMLFIAHNIFAQEECAFILEKAEKMFEEGIISEIPDMLKPCLEKGFTKEEKLTAYKLIILAYLFDDNKMEAEKNMKGFLKKYPEYEILPTDPIEFVFLYESYNVYPLYKVGVFGGMNYTNVNLIEEFGTHNINDKNVDYVASGGKLAGGLRISRYLMKDIDLDLEIMFAKNEYEYDDTLLTNYSLHNDEWRTIFMFPLSLNYTFSKVKYVDPFIRLGIAPGFILSSNANLKGTYLDNSHIPKSGADFSNIERRNNFELWTFFGAGVKYKIPRGYLILDLRYNIGMTEYVQVDEQQIDPTSELLWKYGYVDDKFKLNNFIFTIGYSYTFYKPVKKEK